MNHNVFYELLKRYDTIHITNNQLGEPIILIIYVPKNMKKGEALNIRTCNFEVPFAESITALESPAI